MVRVFIACLIAVGCNSTPDVVIDAARPDSTRVIVPRPDADLSHCSALRPLEQPGCSTDPLPDLAGKWLINGSSTEITFGDVDLMHGGCRYATTSVISLEGFWALATNYTTHYLNDGASQRYGSICVSTTGVLIVRGYRTLQTPGGHEPIEMVDLINGTLTRAP